MTASTASPSGLSGRRTGRGGGDPGRTEIPEISEIPGRLDDVYVYVNYQVRLP